MSPRNSCTKSPARAFLSTLVAVTAVGATVMAASSSPAKAASTARHSVLPVAMKLSQTPAPMPTIGRPAPEQSPDAPIALNSLHRDSSGIVSLTWTVQNNADDMFNDPSDWVNGLYKYAPGYDTGITLTDETAKVLYRPLRADPSGVCICTDSSAVERVLDSGDYSIAYEAYKLPAQVKSVTVSIPGYSPAKNIPIS